MKKENKIFFQLTFPNFFRHVTGNRHIFYFGLINVPFTSIWNVYVDLSFAEFAISSLKLHRIYIVLGKKIDAMKNLHNEPLK